jgi:photosystem II stability/assembly factor-like uncharacterized protein
VISKKTPLLYYTVALVIIFIFYAATLLAEPWRVLGPDGGDARSLTIDPHNPDHIFLGTSTGTIFESANGGRNWSWFAHLGTSEDYVLDHIVIDPQNPATIYVAAWSVADSKAGDLFRSRDGGKTWIALPPMHGKSIRALAIAPSDSKVLTAGALDGVHRSTDGGETWQKISPAEVRDIESVAVDPRNPNVVYAGTWHLAWKTEDGGQNWHHITQGMIEDSDVFSIIVDSANPSVVFASACSGIYRSDSAGESFHKVQGIPFTARRTRVLKQDPADRNTIYAGTTEGLWKTVDGGKSWKQVSKSEIVVNDVLIDPRNSKRVLLATDRAGVLASDDGAQTFVASNHGYSHRYVTALLVDKDDPDTIFAGVVNDREWGGVFSFHNGSERWQQNSAGLSGRDVFSLEQTESGTLIAGTNRGIFELARKGMAWRPINAVVIEDPPASTPKRKSAVRRPVRTKVDEHTLAEARVNEIEIRPHHWLAATSAGLFSSLNEGKTWTGGPVLGEKDFVAVHSQDDLEVLATRTAVFVSTNGGGQWQRSTLPAKLTSVHGVTTTTDGQILLAAREGAFRSSDAGATWERMQNGLWATDISSISYDESRKALLATSMMTGFVYESDDNGRSWHRGPDSGFPLRRINVTRGRYIAATPFDGVVLQPQPPEEGSRAAGNER